MKWVNKQSPGQNSAKYNILNLLQISSTENGMRLI